MREARPEDEAAMGALGAMLVEEHHEFDSRRFIAPLQNLAERYGQFLSSQIDRPEESCSSPTMKARSSAMLMPGSRDNDYMALRGPAGVLYDLVVDPGHRRRGIGTLLMEAALEASKISERCGLCFSPPKKILVPRRCSNAQDFGGRWSK